MIYGKVVSIGKQAEKRIAIVEAIIQPVPFVVVDVSLV